MELQKRVSVLHFVLVEDNEDDIESVRRAVRQAGVDAALEVIQDGQEASDRFDGRAGPGRPMNGEHEETVLLLDLGLPRLDGIDILRRLKADPLWRRLPVVVISGSRAQRQIEECMRLGCNMYVLKPLDVADVANIISGLQRYWQLEPPARLRAA